MFRKLYNKIEGILWCGVMSKQNLNSLTKSPLNIVKMSNRLTYHQPRFYYLGTLEKIQGDYNGEYCDAGGRYYNY